VKARVVAEAAGLQGWERYIGPTGRGLGMEGFGASAPYQVLAEKFGFTAERLAELAEEALAESRTLEPAGT